MKIKICGITNQQDAQFLKKQSIDFLGFIFHKPSSSYVLPEKCQKIIQALKLINTVGVFLNLPIHKCQKILNECSLTYAQLHGNESIYYAKSLPVKIIKTFRISPTQSKNTIPILKNHLTRWQKAIPDILFLLDTYKKELQGAGGTGEVFNWEIAKELAVDFPIILSGGLNSDNIKTAINLVKPWGVDIKSGVEKKLGIKDHLKIINFINLIKKK